MPKLHGANVLSGLGRAGPFTRNAMPSESPQPQRSESRVGHCLYKIVASEYLTLIFLGEYSRDFKNYLLLGAFRCTVKLL